MVKSGIWLIVCQYGEGEEVSLGELRRTGRESTKELNQLTGFRYNAIIQKVINRCYFINAWNQMDFKEASRYSADMDRGWMYEKTIFLMSLFPRIAKKILEYKRRNN